MKSVAVFHMRALHYRYGRGRYFTRNRSPPSWHRFQHCSLTINSVKSRNETFTRMTERIWSKKRSPHVCSRFKFARNADVPARTDIRNAVFTRHAELSALTISRATDTSPKLTQVGLPRTTAADQTDTLSQPFYDDDRVIRGDALKASSSKYAKRAQ